MKKIFLFLLFWPVWASAQEISVSKQAVYPVREKTEIVSLNGTWDFRYVSGEVIPASDARFYEPGFTASGWDKIFVPSHWETAGFNTPRYAREVEAARGLYRTEFKIPRNWDGKHIFIRFDGVLYGYKLYVNGRFAGEWNSAYNPCQFDITPYIDRGGTNLLAVEVTTRSRGWEFDTNDCWGLSGIFRDVELFPVPELHLRDIVFRSFLREESDARVTFDIDIATFGDPPAAGSEIQISLFDHAMRNVCSFSEPIDPSRESYHFERVLRHVNHWTAETPYLYTMTAKILDPHGRVVQQVREKVGIREISTAGGVFRINGKPVLLRGVCNHEIDLRLGRALTDYERLRDLNLMKAANVNFIRTSHYPQHPRFLELCDEMGFYVDCEVPFGFGDRNLSDPGFEADLCTRAEATLTRDKNHPSVIFWSAGNENPYMPIVEKTLQYIRAKDPTRPRTIPTTRGRFMREWETYSDNIDLYCFHYPTAAEMDSLARILDKPVILTEYSHSLGLAFENLEALYGLMLKYDNMAGGNAWLWADQALLAARTEAEFLADSVVMGVWKDSATYFDSFGNKGTDGIVYADRYPSEDFWYLRKVYTPFVVHTGEIPVSPGRQRITLDIENRFDFISLHGYVVRWSVKGYRETFASGVSHSGLAPRSRGTLELDVVIPDAGTGVARWLEIVCYGPDGRQIYEKNITLRTDRPTVFADRRPMAVKAVRSGGRIAVSSAGGFFALERDGRIVFRSADGKTLIDGFPVLRVGRKPTINVINQAERRKEVFYWDPYLLHPRRLSSRIANAHGGGTEIEVTYRWDRPEKPGEYVQGTVTCRPAPDGSLEIAYDLHPVDATGVFLEFGLGFELPGDFDTFRWVGWGPFASTPGKTAFNEPGVWGLHKNDLRFTGNRAGVDLALFTAGSSASGLGYMGSGGQLGVEHVDGRIVMTDNRWITGYGTKIYWPGTNEKPAAEMGRIQGSFRLTPVAPDSELFREAFDPDAQIVPEMPFAKSYGF